MDILSTGRAARSVLKRYGLSVFLQRTLSKLKKHNFEKADLFLNRKQGMPVPSFGQGKPMVEGLVSVVVPCYNHEDFVEEALASIYRQSYEKIELIVVDDCSQDASPKIVETLFDAWEKEGRFYNLTFIAHKENQGAHNSIDEAINLTQGEYIAVLNSDDFYDPSRFNLMVSCLEAYHAGIGFSRVEVVDEKGNLKSNSPFSELQKGIDSSIMFYRLCQDNLAISSGNLFFRRSLIEEIGLFRDFQYIHDWDFLMRAALTTSVCFCKETAYYYRMHSTNSYLSLIGDTKLCDAEMIEMRSRVFQTVYNNEKSDFYSEEEYTRIIDLLYRRLMNDEGLTLGKK
ncbi:MAG: glycosyltransferase family A protein [Eubacteriales bacterium]